MHQTFSTHALSLVQRLQRGMSAIELIYVPHKRWPYHPRRISPPNSLAPIRVSILDSSFNPPTLAHLALANTVHPHVEGARIEYEAKLLLLSVRNAEKSLKPGDASYVQRLEMMRLLAEDVDHHDENIDLTSGASRGESNVAVAIIDEPTFVGKSRTLLPFLRNRLSALHTSSSSPPPTDSAHTTPKIRLTFLQGFDTLERLFSPRFYHSKADMFTSLRRCFSSTGDDSSIVCARRSMSSSNEIDQGNQTMILAQEFISTGHLVLIDIGEDERTFSSSDVREKRSKGDDKTWRRLVTDKIAEYIIKQSLYVHVVRDESVWKP